MTDNRRRPSTPSAGVATDAIYGHSFYISRSVLLEPARDTIVRKMKFDSKIYVAGHRGLAGSAIVRCLQAGGWQNLVLRTHAELDLAQASAVDEFFSEERPEYVFLAAAKVGGILANTTYPAEFIRDNLAIELNVIDAAYRYGAKKLEFLGSSCIYPKLSPQPIKEEYLLTGRAGA